MKRKISFILFTIFLSTLLLHSSLWAGQVVTDDVKIWAQEAIKRENTLKTISKPNTVAIVYFHNKTNWSKLDLLEKGIAYMLITDLAKLEEIQLVERIKIQALVKELDLSTSVLVEEETAARMGKLLGVENLIGGDIHKIKKSEFKFASNMLKVPTETIFGQPEADGKLLDELFRMEKYLLFDIIKQLKIQLSSDQIEELNKPLTNNLKALFYLFEAIDHSDNGNYDKAIEAYEKALKADPHLMLAQYGIDEILSLGLLDRPEAEAYEVPFVLPDIKPVERPDDQDEVEKEKNAEQQVGGEIEVSWDFSTDTEDGDGSGDGTDDETNDQNVTGRLLSYAVQSEELQKAVDAAEYEQTLFDKLQAISSISDALSHSGLRQFDDLQTKEADAKAGKVLKDRNGSWVRVEQYLVRPKENSVRLVTFNLRQGSGQPDALSTIDWNTTFTDNFGGDLRNLPWSAWLDTRDDGSVRYVQTTNDAPGLQDMSVKFTNPSNEYLLESRAFDGKTTMRDIPVQHILSDTLTLSSLNREDTGPYQMQKGEYHVESNSSNGFDYVFSNGPDRISVSSFIISDEETATNENQAEFKDIWDMLRVNQAGAPNIGNKNLELVIDDAGSFFQNPIDVIYVPMSRMEWRSDLDM